MTARTTSFALFGLIGSASAGMAVAQAVAPTAPAPRIAPQVAAPATAVPPVAAPAPLPPPVWSIADAQALLAYIEQLGTEGLTVANYSPAGLATAIRGGDV